MILGISVIKAGVSAFRGSGWALLDERRGEFLSLGVLPSEQKLVERFAVIANRAAGCEIIATNAESKQLREVAKACAVPGHDGRPTRPVRVVTIPDARWRAATMPVVPPEERTDPLLLYAAGEHILKGHPRAYAQLVRIPAKHLVAVASATMIALGAALTTSDIRARVLSDTRYVDPDDEESPRERTTTKRGELVAPGGGRFIQRARLELVEHRDAPNYQTRVLERARTLALESEGRSRALARARAEKGATPATAPDRHEQAARRDLLQLEIHESSPRFGAMLAALVEKRRQLAAAGAAGAA